MAGTLVLGVGGTALMAESANASAATIHHTTHAHTVGVITADGWFRVAARAISRYFDEGSVGFEDRAAPVTRSTFGDEDGDGGIPDVADF